MKQLIFSINEKYLMSIFYPVLSAFLVAFFIGSIIGVFYYRSITIPVKFNNQKPVLETDEGISITEILEKNIFGLKEIDETNTMGGNISGGEQNINTEKVRAAKEEQKLKNNQLLGILIGERNVALLKDGEDLKVLTYGQVIEGFKVNTISFSAVEFEKDGNKIALYFPREIEKHIEAPPLPATVPTAPTQGNNTSREILKDKIVIKRAEVLSQAQNINQLLTTVRISPYYQKQGEFTGYRLGMLTENSFLYKLGLRRGDILKRIDGQDISSPQNAIELLSRLSDITAVNIDIIRGVEKKSLFIEVEE